MRAAKIIALLISEPRAARIDGSRSEFDSDANTATALVRDDQGRMSLRPFTRDLTREMPFAEQVMTTGCFRRGKEIIDPVTREVMGYEMEMISDPEMQMSTARLQLGY